MFVKTKPRRKPKPPESRGTRSAENGVERRVPAQERSKQRVERILEAAGHVFGEQGFEAATMEAIAERAETSIGSIYQFFPNKLAVFNALAARYRDRTRVLVDGFLAGPVHELPWRDLLDSAIDAFAAFHENEPGFRAVWVGVHLTAEVVSEGEAFNREVAKLIQDPIGDKLPGLPRDMRAIVALMIVEVMTAMLILALRRPSQAKAALDETKRMLHRYLEPWETEMAAKPRGAIRSKR